MPSRGFGGQLFRKPSLEMIRPETAGEELFERIRCAQTLRPVAKDSGIRISKLPDLLSAAAARGADDIAFCHDCYFHKFGFSC